MHSIKIKLLLVPELRNQPLIKPIKIMSTYHIATQSMENYGAHADSGKYEEGKSYWKFKGGTDYIITGAKSIQEATAFVASIATENNVSWKEWVSSFDAVSADFKTEMEKSQLEYEGEIKYPATRINLPEYMSPAGVAKRAADKVAAQEAHEKFQAEYAARKLAAENAA